MIKFSKFHGVWPYLRKQDLVKNLRNGNLRKYVLGKNLEIVHSQKYILAKLLKKSIRENKSL